ncbi:hypothetical protein CGJ25_17255 [Vibrio parahaemolyticus]|nr:hypothetical protein CGK19_21380 [Vibrio parahaemolyticus]TOF29616.1 hypothetical protein CGJ25_17255 [Vibrio parahaemolyticus]
MHVKQIQGQTLKESIVVENIKTEGSLQALEDLYPLREVEFERLQNGANKLKQSSIQMSFALLGYALSVGPQLYDDHTKITAGQWAVLLGGAFICFVLFLISACTKDRKKEVINKIENYFSDEVLKK